MRRGARPISRGPASPASKSLSVSRGSEGSGWPSVSFRIVSVRPSWVWRSQGPHVGGPTPTAGGSMSPGPISCVKLVSAHAVQCVLPRHARPVGAVLHAVQAVLPRAALSVDATVLAVRVVRVSRSARIRGAAIFPCCAASLGRAQARPVGYSWARWLHAVRAVLPCLARLRRYY